MARGTLEGNLDAAVMDGCGTDSAPLLTCAHTGCSMGQSAFSANSQPVVIPVSVLSFYSQGSLSTHCYNADFTQHRPEFGETVTIETLPVPGCAAEAPGRKR